MSARRESKRTIQQYSESFKKLYSRSSMPDRKNTKEQCIRIGKEAIYLYKEESPHISLQMQTPSEFYRMCLKSVDIIFCNSNML